MPPSWLVIYILGLRNQKQINNNGRKELLQENRVLFTKRLESIFSGLTCRWTVWQKGLFIMKIIRESKCRKLDISIMQVNINYKQEVINWYRRIDSPLSSKRSNFMNQEGPLTGDKLLKSIGDLESFTSILTEIKMV